MNRLIFFLFGISIAFITTLVVPQTTTTTNFGTGILIVCTGVIALHLLIVSVFWGTVRLLSIERTAIRIDDVPGMSKFLLCLFTAVIGYCLMRLDAVLEILYRVNQ